MEAENNMLEQYGPRYLEAQKAKGYKLVDQNGNEL